MGCVGKPGDVNGIVHDFAERLEFSHSMGGEPAWIQMYLEKFPEQILNVRIDANSRYQQCGIDRHIYLPDGKILAIDEKVRDPKNVDKEGEPYRDILLEEFSVWKGDGHAGNKPGWSLDIKKQCDYVAYAIPAIGRCYLLPFELLRLAARANLSRWKTLRDEKGRRCYPLDAPNNGYVTRNCAVGWRELAKGMVEQMRHNYGATTLQLPTPAITGKQCVFSWPDHSNGKDT